MTISELYHWTKENNIEHFDLSLSTHTGEPDLYYTEGDFIIDNNSKIISLGY